MISVVAINRNVPTDIDSKIEVQSGLIFYNKNPKQTENKFIAPKISKYSKQLNINYFNRNTFFDLMLIISTKYQELILRPICEL